MIQLKGNEKGVIAIETALILPLVLLLFAGIFETGRLMVLYQKILHASYNAADTLTRDDTVTSDDIENAFAMAQLTIAPFDASRAKLQMNVVGVGFTNTTMAVDGAEELWQDASMADGPDPTLYEKAHNLGVINEGYLVVRFLYDYEPFIFGGLNFFSGTSPFAGFDIEASYALKSRVRECISYDNRLGVLNDYSC